MPKSDEDIQRDKEKLLDSLKESSGIVTYACEKAGFSRQTYYRWYRDDPEFKARADDISELQIDVAEASLLKKIQKGDTAAIIFYLKTKGKDRGYSERREVVVPGGIDVNQKNLDVSKLSEEERMVLLKIAEKQDKEAKE
ncbi:MAG: hypothetical protein LUH01_09245 [Parabacteroides gordonii]|nr:hypothetical protein [Parabacteroides gordonii]